MDTKTLLTAMEGTLSFTKEGHWLHDGEPVLHQGLADYFSNHLVFSPELNTYVIPSMGRFLPISVEDTPVVVRTLTGGEKEGWRTLLSGGKEEDFAPETLFVSDDNSWYCKVHAGSTIARLSKVAIQHLFPFLEEQEGKYFLVWNSQRIEILKRNKPNP